MPERPSKSPPAPKAQSKPSQKARTKAPVKAPSKAFAPSPKARFDLRTIKGAFLAILFFRVGLGLWALPISARFPETALEKSIALWPPDQNIGAWLQRILVEPWMRYDALHYADIVSKGYNLQEGQSAFHPLYPFLAWPFVKLGVPPGVALLLVSTLCAFGLCLIFTRYVAKFHNEVFSSSATWLLLGGLCGFILFAPYNESLFLLLAVSCLWAVRDERFWLAGLFGGLATLTRQQGVALALPIIWQIAVSRRAAWHTMFAPVLVFCGYGAFVIYRLFVLHDVDFSQPRSPFQLAHAILISPAAQNIMPGQHLATPWHVFAVQWELITSRPNPYHLVIDLVLGAAMTILAFCGWKGLHSSERLFSVAVVVMSLCYFNGSTQPMMALPRHLMLAFPLYIALARWANRTPLTARFVFEFTLVINLLLAGAYFRHGWVP
jgi:hypothetical protein